jgi:hypothetical protein
MRINPRFIEIRINDDYLRYLAIFCGSRYKSPDFTSEKILK